MTTSELALDTQRGVTTIQVWCKAHNIKMFKGRYYINPLQAELYKAQLYRAKQIAETEKAKRKKEYNYIYYHTKTKITKKVDKQIAKEKKEKAPMNFSKAADKRIALVKEQKESKRIALILEREKIKERDPIHVPSEKDVRDVIEFYDKKEAQKETKKETKIETKNMSKKETKKEPTKWSADHRGNTKQRIERLKLMIEVEELNLLKDSIMTQLNKIPFV